MDMMEVWHEAAMGQPHIATVQSGNTENSTQIAHFQTDMDTPLPGLTVTLPYKASGYTGLTLTACGKNLLRPKPGYGTETISGVAYAVADDYSITANGKATAVSTYLISNAYKLPLGKYRVSILTSTGSSGTYHAYFNSTDWGVYGDDYGSGVDLTIREASINRILVYRIEVASGYTANNLKFEPSVNLLGDTGYEKYSGQEYTVTFPSITSGTVDLLAGTVNGVTAFTPISVTAKTGVNNLWSDAGTVSIKYWTH